MRSIFPNFSPITVSALDRQFGRTSAADQEWAAERAAAAEAEKLSPSEQFALLWLRKSELSELVVAKLKSSTVRAGWRDYQELQRRHLAVPKPDGFHRLTPRGHVKANELALDLARELNITVPRYESPAMRQSQRMRRNGFSQAGNA